MITSFQRRANDRRRFWHGYAEWAVRRLAEDGGVGHVARHEIKRAGRARVMFGADMEYQRAKRRHRPYAMRRELAWKVSMR